MDAKKFGGFIAKRRKEQGMTQAELAGRLNVTDKAVSRWERGMGFPDIGTLEPLAQALGVNLLELMRAEQLEEPVEQTEATDALSDTLELVRLQQKLLRQRSIHCLFLGLLGGAILVLGIYLYMKQQFYLSAIGGADGPTAIWVVGKAFWPEPGIACMVIGIAVLVAAMVLGLRRKR